MEAASGRPGAELWNALSDPAPDRARLRLASMVERRRAGEPLQYVMGEWSFRRLDLMVDARVLIPRPETEVVVEVALGELRRATSPRRVVDLGTGSGAIALSLAAEGPPAEVWATDISDDALAVASANLAGLGGAAAARVRLVRGSWYDALPAELAGELALIVSNPPYVAHSDRVEPEVETWEPEIALRSGPTGQEATEAILAQAGRWLRPAGSVVLEMASERADQTAVVAESHGFETSVHCDLSGRPRVLVGRVRA